MEEFEIIGSFQFENVNIYNNKIGELHLKNINHEEKLVDSG